MKNVNKISSIVLLALVLFSCNDYLDEMPRKGNGIELKTIEQLEALLSARAEQMERQALFDWNHAQRYMSDCYELTADVYTNNIGGNEMWVSFEDRTSTNLNCFHPEYTQELEAGSTAWLYAFKNIYLANTILYYLDKVTGGSAEQRDLLAQRAHFMRAYHYYELANCYCVPYCEANQNELGLPISTTIEYKEGSYFRSTLKEVYDFIESELLQSLDISTPLTEGGVRKVWRENNAAVNGFAARFYLTKGDYIQAGKYAQKALDCNSDLVNYNDPSEISQTSITFIMDLGEDMQIPFEYTISTWYEKTQDDKTAMLAADFQKSYYRRISGSSTWMIPSRKFVDKLKAEDLRRKFFYYEDYGNLALYAMLAPWMPEGVPGYSYFCGDDFDSGPCTAEMILIKAESMARQGQWQQAISYLNSDFRPYRISSEATADIINLSASNQEEAINAILEERMLEFPYTLRWHDIRRCNFNNDPNDDITITRHFYELDPGGIHAPLENGDVVTYTLDSHSNKYMYTMAIPESEIFVSAGSIEQNRY